MATDYPYIRVAARAIIIDPEDRLLVQFYEDHNGVWATMPGGGVDKGERLDDGLKREIYEELAIDIVVGPLRYVREVRGVTGIRLLGGLSPDFHQLEHFFEVPGFSGIPKLGEKIDTHATHFEWVPLDDLKQHLFFPQQLIARLGQDYREGFPDGAAYIGDA